jgi:hypothetical protein
MKRIYSFILEKFVIVIILLDFNFKGIWGFRRNQERMSEGKRWIGLYSTKRGQRERKIHLRGINFKRILQSYIYSFHILLNYLERQSLYWKSEWHQVKTLSSLLCSWKFLNMCSFRLTLLYYKILFRGIHFTRILLLNKVT